MPSNKVLNIQVDDQEKYDLFVYDGDEQLYDADGEPFANPFVFRSENSKLAVYVTTNKSKETGSTL